MLSGTHLILSDCFQELGIELIKSKVKTKKAGKLESQCQGFQLNKSTPIALPPLLMKTKDALQQLLIPCLTGLSTALEWSKQREEGNDNAACTRP